MYELVLQVMRVFVVDETTLIAAWWRWIAHVVGWFRPMGLDFHVLDM